MNEKRRTKHENFDVIVIGAGHAGAEAAHIAARLGQKTLLLTTSLDTIGLLACSPSFGGPGRGHLTREVDVLGGLMPKVIDETALHFRHSGKNSASWAPFAVCSREAYSRTLKEGLEKTRNLYLLQDSVANVLPKKNKWQVETAGMQVFVCKTTVIAVGTFLNSSTKLGDKNENAGRKNELEAGGLYACLKKLGFKMGTFRTGTGPTIKMSTQAFKNLTPQQFDEQPRFFSSKTKKKQQGQQLTYKTHTSLNTIKLLARKKETNEQSGPRYCPSLIDKIYKFPEKKEHPVFVQPENRNAKEWFLNGLSMDIDEGAQQSIVNTVQGLEGAQVICFGYSVSYGYLKQGQINNMLESKNHSNLYFAGQITGTNGYEEAAATGLIAGINAALRAKGSKGLEFNRKNSLLGVLAQDIASKKLSEPYRMLLARASNSNDLRCDNADIRLTGTAFELGLAPRDEVQRVAQKEALIRKLQTVEGPEQLDPEVFREVEFYKKKKSHSIASVDTDDLSNIEIPPGLDYSKAGLSSEAIEQLHRFKPLTINEAIKMNVPEKSMLALALYIQRKQKSDV